MNTMAASEGHASIEVQVQATPNPRARKIILDRIVKEGLNAVYEAAAPVPEGAGPMVEALLAVAHITHVYLSDNIITMTQDGSGDWVDMGAEILEKLAATIERHDPSFDPVAEQKPVTVATKDDANLNAISEVLDRTIRPYLQSHGGELDLVSFDPETHRLTVHFQGSCDSCAGSTGGTMYALEGTLRAEYDPHITIHVENEYEGVW